MANQPKKYKKFVATAATATLVASAIVPVASAAGFTDVENNTHKDAINALSDAGIINGYADGTFKPNQTINRGQVVKLLGRWLETEGFEVPSDWETSQRFKDLPLTAEKELVKYAALAKDAGVFAGSNGNLNYTQSMQRQQMAVVLVRAINEIYDLDLVAEYKADGFKSEISDLGAAFSAEQREAITALEYAELTNAANLPGKAFKPADSITRGQFASFLHRTINLEIEDGAVDATVKAVNNTTVEVTFDEKVGNLDELKFEIDGLEIKNKAHKQSNDKVVVLTTAPQEAGKEYTVKLDGEVIGKFKGIDAVIPTSVDIVEKSQQNILGNNVTVKAKVTVADGQSKAGIPVTFNIVNGQENNNLNPGGALNPPIVAEALTDENGVASYTYTRYASTARDLVTNDEVQAYSTGKPSLRGFAKVYWASIKPLSITEVTEGNTIANGGKKVYKVKLAGVSSNVTPGGHFDRTVNIGFRENVNVTPDKAVKTVTVTDASGRELGYPGQFTTTNAVTTSTFNSIVLNLDHNGEATFTLTGSNATVTPFVFKDAYANTSNTDPSYGRFDETELFAEVAKVTFGAQHTLQLVTESLGVQNASAYDASFGGNGAYFVRDAAGNQLYRDISGFLRSNTQTYILQPGEAWITNNNPLRSNEVLPAGFNYNYTNTNASSAGVASLEKADRLNGKSSYRYNMKDASDELAKDLVNTGGRDYKAVLKDKDGKLATTGTPIKLHVKYGSARSTNVAPIYVIDNNSLTVYKISDFKKSKLEQEFDFLTNAKGEISFTIIGGRDSYATPTVFVDTNRSNDLDAADLQHAGEIVYFGDRTITSANLTVNDKNETNAIVSDIANFSYRTVDQNNKPYSLNHNTTSGTQSQEFVTSFQVHSGFGIAYVYATKADAEAGRNEIGSVGQDGTRTFTVRSVNGKADIYVKSAVGNKVTVNASASQGTYPNKTATATFTNQFNEGVNSYVRGKVVAIDKEHKRVLLSDSTGKNVYELSYDKADLSVAGQGINEATFVSGLKVGQELNYTAPVDNKKASFNNTDRVSGVTISTNAVIIINGDQTSVPKTYDFATVTNTGVKVNSDLKVKEIVINGDNITLENLNTDATIVVGILDVDAGKYHASIQNVNDTKLVNVKGIGTALPNVVVNRGDLNTFTVENSTLGTVTLNIAEHVALVGTSAITTLHAKVNGFAITGTGTLTNLILDSGVTQTTRPGFTPLDLTNTKITQNGTVGVPFTVADTTSADTVTFTFTENVLPTNVRVIEILADGTTADSATIAAVTNNSKAVTVQLANTTNIKTKKVVVIYNNIEYLVEYATTSNTWTVTKK
ncbi:S-layer homology domain-containing protein [Lysinibacillus sp. NPDC047702]|uniref:S-layer homology domain-containing protein n=1 Tax=unclassified Lysinibacillus TaxID=2636778 RepID=UPI003D0399AC